MEKDFIKILQLSCQLMEAANRCQLCLNKNLKREISNEEHRNFMKK